MSGASEVVVERSRAWFDRAVELLLPRRCPICDTTLSARNRCWCGTCEAGMRTIGRPICPECRRFIDPDVECDRGHVKPDPSVVYALGAFDGAFGRLVHALKYDGFRETARPLGEHLASILPDADASLSLIVAVPTSPRKRRKRGFGHAEEIAAACAQAVGARYFPDALCFTRRVADQTRLNAQERRANLRDAFSVRNGVPLTGADVLVIDDVMTTGATLYEAARALKAAGVASVTGAVIALNLSQQGGGR